MTWRVILLEYNIKFSPIKLPQDGKAYSFSTGKYLFLSIILLIGTNFRTTSEILLIQRHSLLYHRTDIFLCAVDIVTKNVFFFAILMKKRFITPQIFCQKYAACQYIFFYKFVVFSKNLWNNSGYEGAVISILELCPTCPIVNINVFVVASSLKF